MAKKKKEKDFQKTKLKVGRRLLRGTNDTKTDFKSKKIVLKEMDSRTKDPIKTLTVGIGLNGQTKLLCLNNVNQWVHSSDASHRTGEVITSVCKYLNDSDKRIRSESIKCLKTCINLLHNNDKSGGISPLMPIVLTYINCGLTHIDADIGKDSLQVLLFLVDFCDNSLLNQLMETMNTRIANKSNIDCNELEICAKVVSKIYKNDLNSINLKPKESPIMKWSVENCYCDLNSINYKEKPSFEINFTFQTPTSVDIKEKFFKSLEKIVKNELKILFSKDMNGFTLSVTEARKAIFALKISWNIGLSFELPVNIPMFAITGLNANKNWNKKQNQLITHLNNELKTCLNTFFKNNK